MYYLEKNKKTNLIESIILQGYVFNETVYTRVEQIFILKLWLTVQMFNLEYANKIPLILVGDAYSGRRTFLEILKMILPATEKLILIETFDKTENVQGLNIYIDKLEICVQQSIILTRIEAHRLAVVRELIQNTKKVLLATNEMKELNSYKEYPLKWFASLALKYGVSSGEEVIGRNVALKLMRQASEISGELDVPVLVKLIKMWLDQGNHDRSVLNSVLREELIQVAEEYGVEFDFKKSVASWGKYMRDQRESVLWEWFRMESKDAGQRRKMWKYTL